MAEWFEKAKKKAKAFAEEHIPLVKAYKNLNDGQQLKVDLEQARVTGKSEHHGDNYAHREANIRNGQDGLSTGISSLAIGVAKEGYDIATKIARGDNVAEVLKDSAKDMKNNVEGVVLGLTHPNENPDKLLANLDLDTNQFVPGYDNGIAQMRQSMKADNQLAQAQVKSRIATAKSAKTVRGTQAKKKSKEKTLPNSISTPWQEKTKTDPKTVDWTKPQFMQDGGGR